MANNYSSNFSFGLNNLNDQTNKFSNYLSPQGINSSTEVSSASQGMFGQGTLDMGDISTYAAQLPETSKTSWLNKLFGGKDEKTGMNGINWGGMGLSALQSGANLYLGNKQLGLAEDQFAEAKSQFGKNFGAQVQNYNTDIEDRQNRRYSGAGGAGQGTNNPYQKTDAYMAENAMVA